MDAIGSFINHGDAGASTGSSRSSSRGSSGAQYHWAPPGVSIGNQCNVGVGRGGGGLLPGDDAYSDPGDYSSHFPPDLSRPSSANSINYMNNMANHNSDGLAFSSFVRSTSLRSTPVYGNNNIRGHATISDPGETCQYYSNVQQQNPTRRLYGNGNASPVGMNGTFLTNAPRGQHLSAFHEPLITNGNLLQVDHHQHHKFLPTSHTPRDPPSRAGTPSKRDSPAKFWGQLVRWIFPVVSRSKTSRREASGGRKKPLRGSSRFKAKSGWSRGYGVFACEERRLCRHLCACCRRMPRRLIRGLQWCYGYNERQTLCYGLCDLYSLVLSVITVLLIARDQLNSHCVVVRYTSEYICSERYVSYECNFPDRSFLGDDELFSRCGLHGNGAFRPHADNDTIETVCGPNRPFIGSLRFSTANTAVTKSPAMYKIPNIVHYTVDCDVSRRFDYINYLSFVSVERFVQPDRIYVHCNCYLNSSWWFTTLEDVANIYVVKREFPEFIQARPPRWLEHRADVIKLHTLFHNGGIHLDLDVMIVKPLTSLRHHDLVLGEQDEQGEIGDAIILSKPHDPVVCLWMNGYREYDPWPWQFDKYTIQNLQTITRRFADNIHIVRNTLLKPGPLNVRHQLYEGRFDWRKSYAVKLWRDAVALPLPSNPAEVHQFSSNVGDLLRFVGNWTKPTAPPPTPLKNPGRGPYGKKKRKPKKQKKH